MILSLKVIMEKFFWNDQYIYVLRFPRKSKMASYESITSNIESFENTLKLKSSYEEPFYFKTGQKFIGWEERVLPAENTNNL